MLFHIHIMPHIIYTIIYIILYLYYNIGFVYKKNKCFIKLKNTHIVGNLENRHVEITQYFIILLSFEIHKNYQNFFTIHYIELRKFSE